MPRPWLPAVRHLLGKQTDIEVARRAGVDKTTVTHARIALGISSKRSRPLSATSRAEVLRMVRAQARRGDLRLSAIRGSALNGLTRFHFGGWYQAVEAAGLVALGHARAPGRQPPKRLRPLTPKLLDGPLPAAELERLTGVTRARVRSLRAAQGVIRNERPNPRAALAAHRRKLGVLSDAAVARLAGVGIDSVRGERRRLGIPPAPKPSRATASGLRVRLLAMPKAELRRFLARLEPADAAIVRGRFLSTPPVSLARLGVKLGVSRQAVAGRERRVARVLAVP